MAANDLSLHSAVKDLYCDHHGWLKGWLRQRLGNSCDAADLAQDTFVRVIKVVRWIFESLARTCR